MSTVEEQVTKEAGLVLTERLVESYVVQARLRLQFDEVVTKLAAAEKRIGELEESEGQLCEERDEAEETLDRIAAMIGCGEHSSTNEPWTNALNTLEAWQTENAQLKARVAELEKNPPVSLTIEPWTPELVQKQQVEPAEVERFPVPDSMNRLPFVTRAIVHGEPRDVYCEHENLLAFVSSSGICFREGRGCKWTEQFFSIVDDLHLADVPRWGECHAIAFLGHYGDADLWLRDDGDVSNNTKSGITFGWINIPDCDWVVEAKRRAIARNLIKEEK